MKLHILLFVVSEPVLIAKSSVLLDVKPWDDETDMKAMEDSCRTIVMDGLVWGACKYLHLFNNQLSSRRSKLRYFV